MSSLTCPYSRRCGGCQLLAMSYEEELAHKQELARRHLSHFGRVQPILGAANSSYYRNKVEAAFGLDCSRKVIAGTYEPRSHRIVDINSCLNEDKNATAIIVTIKKLLPSFRLAPYDEDARTGFLRHVLVRRGIHTGEVMVVLVTASPVFPSRQNFIKALLKEHPEITTIVQNVNNRRTSVLLGDREQTLYGPGFIRDTLCGMSFRISPRSFYQINPAQTEVLYRRAIKAAGLTGKERVLDAYCGIGTIGMIAAADAREVIGVEQNPAAVRDAIRNAKENGVENIRFVAADATEWMQAAAAEKLSIDILLMDPPRCGGINGVEKFEEPVTRRCEFPGASPPLQSPNKERRLCPRAKPSFFVFRTSLQLDVSMLPVLPGALFVARDGDNNDKHHRHDCRDPNDPPVGKPLLFRLHGCIRHHRLGILLHRHHAVILGIALSQGSHLRRFSLYHHPEILPPRAVAAVRSPADAHRPGQPVFFHILGNGRRALRQLGMAVLPGKEGQRFPIGQGIPQLFLPGLGVLGQHHRQTLGLGIIKNTSHILGVAILLPPGK